MRKQIYFLTAIFILMTTAVFAQDGFYDRLVNQGYDIVNIENDGVRQYLDDRAYDNPELVSNYYYSIVTKYTKGSSSRPAGIKLRWYSETPKSEISSVKVTLLESNKEIRDSRLEGDLTGANVKCYYPDINSQEYLLCNMRPQKYCYYKIEEIHQDGQATVVKTGRFYTEGRVRMLRVDGMYNVRDFGGWNTSFGKTVAYGRIFRGSRPENITSKGRNDFVKNEHVTADLDLRGTNLSKSPLGPLDEVEYFCTNNQRYKYAVTGSAEALAKDLTFIASVLRRGGSVFLHCNHGVNRAGSLAFVIEGILGYSEADLSRDYELSSFAYGNIRSKSLGDMFPIIRSYGEFDDDLTQCFYNFALSKGVSEETLDTIRCVMLGLSPEDPLILKAHRR